MLNKAIKRSASIDLSYCVACGSCVKVCPFNAITIDKGISAIIDTSKCVGCGKCAKECPASIIELVQS